MTGTVVGLVTPHLLRVIDLANEAETGVNVDWHLRSAVAKSMSEMRDQWNAPALVVAYAEGLQTALAQAPANRPKYVRVVEAAIAASQDPGRR